MPETRASAAPEAAPALVRVGHVRRVHGVRGEVRVQMLGGELARFAPGTRFVGERAMRPLTVAAARALDGDQILLTFVELPSREEVAALSGDYLCVERERARALPPGEWFVWQLVGLRVVTNSGEELGVVRDVEEQPASDVIVVGSGTEERRYPLVREWVSAVDLDAGVVTVTPWPEDDD